MSPRSGIRIRAAALGDAGSIARVHARSWEEAYSSFLPAEVIAARGAPRRLEQWAGMLAAPPPRHAVLVGELDGEVVGFASVGPAEDAQDAVDGSGELHALYGALAARSRRRAPRGRGGTASRARLSAGAAPGPRRERDGATRLRARGLGRLGAGRGFRGCAHALLPKAARLDAGTVAAEIKDSLGIPACRFPRERSRRQLDDERRRAAQRVVLPACRAPGIARQANEREAGET